MNRWKRYESLTKAQQEALYYWMVLDGGVAEEDFEDHVARRRFRISRPTVRTVRRLCDKLQWDWDPLQWSDSDVRRIAHIKQLHRQGKEIWPYITDGVKNLNEWVANIGESSHGDGWHRLVLALQEKRSIDFLFLKLIKNLNRHDTAKVQPA